MRRALHSHEPRFARTRSELERRFLVLCERYEIPLPEVNARLLGFTVDAVWPEQKLAVELDGYDNHATPAQLERDRRRDLRLRAAGFTVVRYTWDLITNEPGAVAVELIRLLG